MIDFTTEEFLIEYGGYGFKNVVFFPGARKTTDFGLDQTFGTIRIHVAIDRAGGPMVHVPFDTKDIELIFSEPVYRNSFGNLIRLKTYGADFEVRIAHFELGELQKEFVDLVQGGKLVPAGTPIAPPGNAGKSTGAHTHTEVISLGQHSEILDDLVEHYGQEEITPRTVKEYAEIHGLDERLALEIFENEKRRRGVEYLTNQTCYRWDYHTGGMKTFYNSWSLFGM